MTTKTIKLQRDANGRYFALRPNGDKVLIVNCPKYGKSLWCAFEGFSAIAEAPTLSKLRAHLYATTDLQEA